MKAKYIIIGGLTVSFGLIVYLMSRPKKVENVTTDKNRPVEKTVNGRVLYVPNWDQPFNHEFADDVKNYLAPNKVAELDPARGKQLSKAILGAKGFFVDDEDKVEKIITDLGSKVHLSGLSRAFYKETNGKDLWRYLVSFINKGKVSRWVSALENYQIQP